MSAYAKTGAQAVAIANFILANATDDTGVEGVLITQQGSGLYVATEAASAYVTPSGATVKE